MKVVINTCFGGFSLSAEAVKRLAELDGRECHFFKHDYKKKTYIPLSMAEAEKGFCPFAFDVPVVTDAQAEDPAWWAAHSLDSRPKDRHDPKLVQVVEELGVKAWGECAELTIVDIPEGVDYLIEEYDGNEHIAERHRTWR